MPCRSQIVLANFEKRALAPSATGPRHFSPRFLGVFAAGARFAARSLARRAAVRFWAAAADAFFARADRSSGVMVSRLLLPPILDLSRARIDGYRFTAEVGQLPGQRAVATTEVQKVLLRKPVRNKRHVLCFSPNAYLCGPATSGCGDHSSKLIFATEPTIVCPCRTDLVVLVYWPSRRRRRPRTPLNMFIDVAGPPHSMTNPAGSVPQ